MLNKSVHIDPKFDNMHWQLYSSKSGHKSVIRKLNSNLKKCVNNGSTKDETRSSMMALMSANSNFGVYDTEPIGFLYYILDRIYS